MIFISVTYKRRRGEDKNTMIIFPTIAYQLWRHNNKSIPIASTFLMFQKLGDFATAQVPI